jgi:hypothetical protein
MADHTAAAAPASAAAAAAAAAVLTGREDQYDGFICDADSLPSCIGELGMGRSIARLTCLGEFQALNLLCRCFATVLLALQATSQRHWTPRWRPGGSTATAASG